MLKTLREREAVLSHLIRAIEDAPRHADPFPHLVVDGVFPFAFHERLCRALPDPAFFEAHDGQSMRRRSLGVPRRFPVTIEECETLPGEARDTWLDAIAVLSSPALHDAVLVAFGGRVHLDEAASAQVYPQISLVRDPGEDPGPTNGGPDVVATIAVPFDALEGGRASRLLLYRRRSRLGALFAGRLRAAARLDGAPNLAWAFAGADLAGRPTWFSLTSGADAATGRTTLLCHFRRGAPDRA